jgi:hypothetical protein
MDTWVSILDLLEKSARGPNALSAGGGAIGLSASSGSVWKEPLVTADIAPLLSHTTGTNQL